ncbi:MAG: hypothetical protein ACOZF0_22740 [Thermodesulfobacteriota bacterium]
MSKIRLDDGTIEYNGQWYTSGALSKIIQDRMAAGDMKIADLAVALETLNRALENTHILEVNLVIPADDYARLIQKGGGNEERECLRQAVMEYIGKTGGSMAPAAAARTEGARTVIKCSHCKNPIEVLSNERPVVIECPNCGTSCRVTL